MSDETQDFSDESWDGNETDDESGTDDQTGSGSDPVSSENGSPQADGAGAGEADGDRRRRRRRGRDDDSLDSFDERARRAQAFVDDVVRKMGMDFRVRLRRPREGDSVDEINLEILGKDAGRIIGKKGQVLQAIQFLVHRVVNRPGVERRHILVARGFTEPD